MSKEKAILFVTPPELGHLLPTIGIARDLARESFRIVYLTGGFFEPLLQRHGFEIVALLPSDVEDTAMQLSAWTYWYTFDAVNGWRADLALIDRINEIVRKLNIYGVVVDDLFIDRYGEPLSQYLATLPCFAIGITLRDWTRAEKPTVVPRAYLCPAAFEIPSLVWRDANVHYVEPSIYNEFGAAVDRPREVRRPHVLVAFGTQSSIMHSNASARLQLIIELAASFPETDFTIACGRGILSSCVNETSANVKIQESVPQLELLRRSDMFITHGGLSSIKEGIISGVPLLVLPAQFDQPFNAIRVEVHGIGEAIFPEELTLAALTAAFLRIRQSATVREKLSYLQKIFIDEQTNRRAAQLILESFAK
jgi:UDP:flavonoid glycosyltransferase YjiC (YdhE family)